MHTQTVDTDAVLNPTYVTRAEIDEKPLKITLRRRLDEEPERKQAAHSVDPICRECGRRLSAHDARTGAPHLFKPVGPRR